MLEPLRSAAVSLTRTFGSSIPAWPEDQLKAPITEIIRTAGSLFGLTIDVKTEARVEEIGRPDIAAAVGGLLTGHVELKAPGKGADVRRFTGRDRQQWNKFKALPNLVYTDGSDWALYRAGERVGRTTLSGDVTTNGAAAVTPEDAEKLSRLLRDFLSWSPSAPRSPPALAAMLAPLCRLIRDDVLRALEGENSSISGLAREWRDYLFPDADNATFADAYAQTLTYSLLLARLSGSGVSTTDAAAHTLRRGHGLLAQTLRLLGDPAAREEIALGVDLLERTISAVDPTVLSKDADPWLYFYEDFLAAYDRKLRNDRGVYYTPVEVVQTQVGLVSQLLEEKLGKELGYAEEGVVLLDPAAGTGTYVLAALQHGIDRAADIYGPGMGATAASRMAANIHAFEILVGPYAVAHLRVSERIQGAGGGLPQDGAHVYLTDTLESPYAQPQGQLPLIGRALAEEHRRALRVKDSARVLVCIGNPPYDRQQIDQGADGTVERKGGWVRYADSEDPAHRTQRPILEDFLAPARAAGQGRHLKNLYNDYVYFWRWAMWKVFEPTNGPGITSFITASSYMRGPGFVGMRELMRRTFDELWIIDLEGDQFGARKTENVFAIRTPVAIAVGVRYGEPRPNEPAKVHYARITGTRDDKLSTLRKIERFEDLRWQDCFTEWMRPFLPEGQGDYYSWPLLTDLFPWQYSGVQMKRTWPIGETPDVLNERWRALLAAPNREALFLEAGRKVGCQYPSIDGSSLLPAIAQLPATAPPPQATRYGFRSFDRQWIFEDARLGDRLRPPLWLTHSDKQVYMTSLLTKVLGLGPAASVTANIPDLDHFSGRGGKDVIPLWRDAGATEPNVTAGLLDVLSTAYGQAVSPEDLFAYAYGILASRNYVIRFSEELTVPGPRLPITKDPALFKRIYGLGRDLIALHTYGERFMPGGGGTRVPRGQARAVRAISTTPDKYPEISEYDPGTRTLRVGDGEIAPVNPEVWNYSVSGLMVVHSWLKYRKKSGSAGGRSELDKIRPVSWTFQMTRELLELLWVLEATISAEAASADVLDALVTSDLFTSDDLPKPSEEEKKPPIPERQADATQGEFELA